MKVAIIFDNFGPYHMARLNAGARISELTAVQVTARSAEYAWENEVQVNGFQLVTLFPDGASLDQRRSGILPKMSQALSDSRPQAVFIPGWSSHAALAALSWCTSQRVPAIVMSESTAWDEKRSWSKEWIKRRLITLYSAALVGGNPQADYIVQLGMSPDRISVGYDAVDNEYFQQKTEKVRDQSSEVRTKQRLPLNYFLASARFIDKKNLPGLLEAYARYRTACGKPEDQNQTGHSIPWSLVLLGDGPLHETLVSQIANLNLQRHVVMPGFKQYPDLPTYYALAGAFIHASRVEQWGLVVNEAMASGLPVLVSNRCGCAADLVQEGRNGFTFDPSDIEEFATLMKRVSTMEPGARKAMGRESERIIAEWGPRRFAEGMSCVAQKALAVNTPKAGSVDRLLLRALLLR